ncbi:MAG: hypothetical protein H0X34_18235 [Chthoniobacterales bacterium]|nr:hypothetical protein [Chthoniobacterales bacterium]
MSKIERFQIDRAVELTSAAKSPEVPIRLITRLTNAQWPIATRVHA